MSRSGHNFTFSWLTLKQFRRACLNVPKKVQKCVLRTFGKFLRQFLLKIAQNERTNTCLAFCGNRMRGTNLGPEKHFGWELRVALERYLYLT